MRKKRKPRVVWVLEAQEDGEKHWYFGVAMRLKKDVVAWKKTRMLTRGVPYAINKYVQAKKDD